MPTPLPSKIGKYDLVGLLGRGESGAVFHAVDPELDRRVAIKMIAVVTIRSDEDAQRFAAEAEWLGRLQHPNIVRIDGAGVQEGYPYLVMEYLDGDSLEVALSAGRTFTTSEKVRIVIQVCRGLANAHASGVMHYGIEPANIMLCRDGEVKITGFVPPMVAEAIHTRPSEFSEKLKYLAPEHVRSAVLDSHADIYSAGVVLHQLLCDCLPSATGETDGRSLSSECPRETEAILARALGTKPEDRYNSADEFAADLEGALEAIKEQSDAIPQPVIGEDSDDLSAEPADSEAGLSNSTAIRLVGQVEAGLQGPEKSKPVIGLWVKAERALAEEQFERALENADKALAMDPGDADLQQLRETIRLEAAQKQKLCELLNSAHAAQLERDLDRAREATEKALEIAPNHAEAKALHQLISGQILERARQKQVEAHLRDARQEISSGNFTGAIEILRRAEELDRKAPGVQSLIQLAVSGHQQEMRRNEIAAVNEQIREALNRDDFATAVRRADEALARFPQERSLMALKAQAEDQLKSADAAAVFDKQLAAARDLFQGGRFEDAHERLQQLLTQYGPEPRVQSLLTAIEAELRHHTVEGQRSTALGRASEALRREAYDEAIRILRELATASTQDLEIHQWLEKAQTGRADALQTALRKADEEPDLKQSKIILLDAIQKLPSEKQLEEKLSHVSHVDQMVSKALSEARGLEEAGQYESALAKWEMVRVLHPRHPELKGAVKRIRGLQEQSRENSRETWIARAERALSSWELAEASAVTEKALQEFPWDTDLMGLQERAQLALRNRAKAQKLMADGRKSMSKHQWEAGARTMGRAFQTAPEDASIQEQIMKELLEAAEAAMNKIPQAAEWILKQRAKIEGAIKAAQPAQSATEAGRASPMPSVDATSPLPARGANDAEVSPSGTETARAPATQSFWEATIVPPGVVVDNARFTVIAPGSLLRGAESAIQFRVYVGKDTEAEPGRAGLARPIHDEGTTAAARQAPLQRGARLSVRLRLGGGLKSRQLHKWFYWNGETGCAEFDVTVPPETAEGDMVCLASIRLNGCQIARLTFLLHIGSKMTASQVIPCQTLMHRKAFASFDGMDKEEVLARVQGMEAVYTGLKVYVDAPSLRSVTYWEPDLHARIDAADVFYLFWCRHAQASDWVSREWHWALRSKGLEFIDPVCLESPETAPPPVELTGKQFQAPLGVFSESGTVIHPS